MEKDKILLIFKDLEIDKSSYVNCESGSTVNINNVIFEEGLISQIKFIKHHFPDSSDSLFIEAFMGNIKLITLIVKNDYLVDIDRYSIRPYYYIRKAGKYDY